MQIFKASLLSESLPLQGSPFHHNECEQRAVLSITMSVNRGQSYAGHSVQWGAPVTFNSTLARVPDIAPTHHCCCSHITHTQGSTHTFFTPPLPFQQACIVCRGHARVVQFGMLFGGPLVHTQGHLHWSQQLHTHISADVHTRLTPREALTHFSNSPFPCNGPVYWARTCGQFGLLSGATCAHTGTPPLVPTITPTHQC